MKKQIKVYNVLFPLWMLLMFPVAWLVVLPGNFIIDSLVLLILMKVLHITDKKSFYKKSILKIFGIGIFSDVIGSAFLFFMVIAEIARRGDDLYLTIPALLIAAVLIYFLNYFISFRRCEKSTRIKIALTFAIATAPYTFLFPSAWLYGF